MPENYEWNPHAIPVLATAITSLAVGVFVLVHERLRTVSLSFLFITLTVAVWLSGFSMAYLAADKETAGRWIQFSFVAIPFIPSANYFFTACFLKIASRQRVFIALTFLVSTVLFISAMTTDAFIRDIKLYPWGYYFQAGPLNFLFIALIAAAVIRGLMHLWTEYRQALPETAHRRRVFLFLIAFSVGYLAVLDLLPAYGVALYPMGYFPILFFVVICGWCVWHYHLVDITPAFAADQIMEAMSDVLLVMDRQGVVRVANHAAFSLFKCRETEMIGRRIFSFAPDFFPKVLSEN